SRATLEAGPFPSLDRQSILEQPTASKPERASSAPWLQVVPRRPATPRDPALLRSGHAHQERDFRS
ncbi:MAG: hypothetical protein ABSG60_15005, partial [Terracidiphilus sp.]